MNSVTPNAPAALAARENVGAVFRQISSNALIACGRFAAEASVVAGRLEEAQPANAAALKIRLKVLIFFAEVCVVEGLLMLDVPPYAAYPVRIIFSDQDQISADVSREKSRAARLEILRQHMRDLCHRVG